MKRQSGVAQMRGGDTVMIRKCMRCCDDSDTDDEAPWDQEPVATGEHCPVSVQAAALDTPKLGLHVRLTDMADTLHGTGDAIQPVSVQAAASGAHGDLVRDEAMMRWHDESGLRRKCMRCVDDSDSDGECHSDTDDECPAVADAAVRTEDNVAEVLCSPHRAHHEVTATGVAVLMVPVHMATDGRLSQCGPPRMAVSKECAGCRGDSGSNEEVSSKPYKEQLVANFSKRVIAFAKTIVDLAIVADDDPSPGGVTALDMFEADLKSFTEDLNMP